MSHSSRILNYEPLYGHHMCNILYNVDCYSVQKGDHCVQSKLMVHKDIPPMDANVIVSLGLHIVRKLPEELYSRLEEHPYCE